MRHSLYILVGLASLSGCTIAYYSTYNLVREPCLALANHDFRSKARKEAKEAWKHFSSQNAEWCSTGDFEDGFVDGFADFLDNGGNAEPPAVPPSRYRKNKYLNPEGFQAIDRYFAGFAAGARTAKESGRRDTLVVPILVPAEPLDPNLNWVQPNPTPPDNKRPAPLMDPRIQESGAGNKNQDTKSGSQLPAPKIPIQALNPETP